MRGSEWGARLLREPLLHFAVIGGLLFAGYQMIAEPGEAPVRAEVIMVTSADTARLDAAFERTWRRSPNGEERKKLVDSFVREEILNREAKLLGLDTDDEIIRRRLVQKMDYLLSASADLEDPADAELQEFYRNNRERYRRPARVAFQQVYLGETAEQDDIAAMREALNGGADPGLLGQRTLLPRTFGPGPESAADRLFGGGFSKNLEGLKTGEWSRPVQSGYGQHLVLIEMYEPAGFPELAKIRDAVIQDWKRRELDRLKAENFRALADRYTVEYPDRG
jgi:hypothetical protein